MPKSSALCSGITLLAPASRQDKEIKKKQQQIEEEQARVGSFACLQHCRMDVYFLGTKNLRGSCRDLNIVA